MPRKLRYSLTTFAAIALVAAFASSAAQAQFKNATGAAKGTNIRPWITTHGSNRSVGRNDGYVQQSTSTVKPAGLYGVSDLAQRSYKPNRANDRLRSEQQRQVQGGTMLDKPTFGQKFMMSLDKNKSVNSVKGAKPQRGNTERELMDKMGVAHRN